MRKHIVNARIEGESAEGKADIQRVVNIYYAQNIGKILQKSGLSKEEKIEVIEEIQKIVKKY